MGDVKVSAYWVQVKGLGKELYYASSTGDALSQAWRNEAFKSMSFKQFLRVAKAFKAPNHIDYGRKIKVLGQPAYLIDRDGVDFVFVWMGEKKAQYAHPFDVQFLNKEDQ